MQSGAKMCLKYIKIDKKNYEENVEDWIGINKHFKSSLLISLDLLISLMYLLYDVYSIY